MNKVNEDDVFFFLDALRESGEVNMFGASLYVAEAFGVDDRTARELTVKWMNTFAERHPE